MTATLKVTKGDITLNTETGLFDTVVDRDKLRQDVRQALDRAGLDDLVGRVSDPFSLRAEVTRLVTASLDALVRAQSSVQASDRTPTERVGSLANVQVVSIRAADGTIDPLQVAYRVDVRSIRGPESLSFQGILRR